MEQLYASSVLKLDSRELISSGVENFFSDGSYKIIKPLKIAEKSTETVLYSKTVFGASGIKTGSIDSDATLGGMYQAKAIHWSKGQSNHATDKGLTGNIHYEI